MYNFLSWSVNCILLGLFPRFSFKFSHSEFLASCASVSVVDGSTYVLSPRWILHSITPEFFPETVQMYGFT